MTIYMYLLCFSLIPVLYMLLGHVKNKNKVFCFFSGLVVFAMLINTPVELRADYPIYSGGYDFISGLSFRELCDGFHLLKRFDLPWPYVFESGFVVIQWLSSHIGMSFVTWTWCYAAVCSIVTSYFIYKYSAKGWISFILWMAFYFYSIVGRYRQTIALLCVVISIKYIKEKNLLKFLALIIIAFLFHQSSFVFIPMYFIGNIRIDKKKYLKLLIIVSAAAFIMGNFILSRVLAYFGYNLGLHVISFKINKRLLLVLVFCIIAYLKTNFKVVESDKDKSLIYWGIVLALGMCIIGAYENMVSRAVEYYFVFFILLVPDLLSYYRKHIQFLSNIVLYLALLVFYYMEIAASGLILT